MKHGPADKSYGVHVAELAGMPVEILQRAKVLLAEFEAQGSIATTSAQVVEKPLVTEQSITPVLEVEEQAMPTVTTSEEDLQLSLFDASVEEKTAAEKDVLHTVMKLNVMGTTPMQAMTLLFELQQKLLSEK